MPQVERDAPVTFAPHAERVVLPNFPGPYESLLAFFERGGGFILISGYIDVDLALVPRWDVSQYLVAEPVVDLDPARLNEFDGL